MLFAPGAQLRLRQLLVRASVGVPELEHAEEFGIRVGELRVRVVGGFAGVGGALARVLDAEEGGDHQHLAQHMMRARGDQHARQLRIDRQARHVAANAGEPPIFIDSAQFAQGLPTVADGARVRRIDERKILDSAQTEIEHAQDHARQRGAQDFRIGVTRPRLEIGFRIQAIADAGGDTAAAALALVGAGL